MDVKPGDIVTVNVDNTQSSNTFIVDKMEDSYALLRHPLAPSILIRHSLENINLTSANPKDSTERNIEYAVQYRQYLDYNSSRDLESIQLFFVVKRQLTPKQKQHLAQLCGSIASIKFNGDIKETMSFIVKNKVLLDEFNLMWFNNFRNLFNGSQPITSKKQRAAIFNIAGFILAELGTT
jgi:hypothetical protein